MTVIDGREHRRLIRVRDTINRINDDARFAATRDTLKLRVLATTTVWVTGVERDATWQRICDIIGLNGYQFWSLIGADAPRYAPPTRYARDRCAVPKTRGEGTCGKSPERTFRVTDAATGEWHMAGFCARHRDYGAQVAAVENALRKTSVPEPLPNTGGLLPCYINADWPDLYLKANGGWKPPRVGIRADDWPVMEKVTAAEPPRLHVVAGAATEPATGATQMKPIFLGGVEMKEQPVPTGEGSAPTLRLVRDDDTEEP